MRTHCNLHCVMVWMHVYSTHCAYLKSHCHASHSCRNKNHSFNAATCIKWRDFVLLLTCDVLCLQSIRIPSFSKCAGISVADANLHNLGVQIGMHVCS